jgi:C4-dicarboxylate-specific signal transduction histidine kinase
MSNKNSEHSVAVRALSSKTKISGCGNLLMFGKGVGLDLRSGPQRRAPRQLIEEERMSAIGTMACSISHDMRQSLSVIMRTPNSSSTTIHARASGVICWAKFGKQCS